MLRKLAFRALVPILVFKFAGGPTPLSAQQATAEIPGITIRANTRLVIVDVVVTDKKGQPVTGLKADDFTVEENGKKQKISVFVPPGANEAKTQPAPLGIITNRAEYVGPAGVPTVLLLDAANSPFKDQSYARSQMLRYAVEQGKSGHALAVLTLTDQVRVLQQFTSDSQILATAIKNLKPQEQILLPAPPVPESHAITTGVRDSGAGALNPAGTISSAIISAQIEAQQFADMQVGYNLERRTQITIEAMKALSRILGGLPGRKNVVWLTSSLPFDLVPEDRNVSDAELMADLPGQGRQRPVSVNAAGTYAAEARQLHGGDIKEAESQLASANIAIYPVDLTGLMSGLESSADRGGSVIRDTALSDRAGSNISIQQANQGTMEEVAAETGGKAYKNQNEIKDGITLAVADEKGSYSLGYYPESKKWDGKFRSFKVKVDRGDIQLRYRKGFFAVDPGQVKNAKYESDVAAALEVGAPATQVSFMAQAKPTDPGKMRVVFLVDAHTLTVEDAGGKKKMNVALYASVYDRQGKNLGTRSTKIDQAFDSVTYQQILDKGMMVPIDMEIPAGGQELRLAVLDNKTGFIGTANGPLGQ
jgi:VWFA-related protein